MARKHPHYDVIVAWAEGKTIQYWCNGGHCWYDWTNGDVAPPFQPAGMYRVKPETIRYRAYLRKVYYPGPEHCVEIVMEEDNKKEPREKWKNFVRWLGDWQEVEV